jgi:hypothetical protein
MKKINDSKEKRRKFLTDFIRRVLVIQKKRAPNPITGEPTDG